jgi:hypothetical protein
MKTAFTAGASLRVAFVGSLIAYFCAPTISLFLGSSLTLSLVIASFSGYYLWRLVKPVESNPRRQAILICTLSVLALCCFSLPAVLLLPLCAGLLWLVRILTQAGSLLDVTVDALLTAFSLGIAFFLLGTPFLMLFTFFSMQGLVTAAARLDALEGSAGNGPQRFGEAYRSAQRVLRGAER